MYSSEISDYQLNSIITECCGGVAVVYSGVFKPNGQNVAIKRFFMDKAKENANLIQQEILTTRQLQHPNILPYFISFVKCQDLYVISPLMSYGSCRNIINKYFTEGLPELVCCLILKEVLQGLDYLHKKGFIHRGIRASHVLLGLSGNVCLTGMRSAISLVVQGKREKCMFNLPPPNHNNSSLIWLSPEVLEQNLKGYDEKSDIYSMGMLTCELANGAIPFSDIPTTLMFTEKVRGSSPQLLDCSTFPVLNFPEDNEVQGTYNTDSGVGDSVASGSALHIRQVYVNRKLSEPFHHFSELCLQREPSRRPTASQLLSHSFFKQIKKSDFLPNLISRAKPIKPEPDDISALLLEEKLAEMDIDNSTDWEF